MKKIRIRDNYFEIQNNKKYEYTHIHKYNSFNKVNKFKLSFLSEYFSAKIVNLLNLLKEPPRI